jgi:hypothetical protein
MNQPNYKFLVVFILLSTSCARYTYTQQTFNLEEAVDKGSVLVELKNGKKYHFKNITKTNNGYRGIKNGSYVPLVKEDIKHLKLAYGKVNSATIYLNDRSKLKGYLYEVLDSAIVLSFKDETATPITIGVNNIRRIYINKSGTVGKGYVIGTATGMGIGLVLGSVFLAQEGSDFGVFFPLLAFTGTFGIAGSLVGLLGGALASGRNFDIFGSINLLNENREALEELSYFKEE